MSHPKEHDQSQYDVILPHPQVGAFRYGPPSLATGTPCRELNLVPVSGWGNGRHRRPARHPGPGADFVALIREHNRATVG